jgi:two-component system response regulator RstA
MKRILLVEDDKKLARLIEECLENQGFSVASECRGDKAVYRILHEKYSLVLLDINLPELDGLQVCKLVRKNFPGFIIMLTAREGDDDQITGLEFGADDYIKKPIQPKVLLARINAISRRTQSVATMQSQLKFGNLIIDLERREVKLNDAGIDLKPTEYELLLLLAVNAGICLSRDNIMYALRGIDYDGVDRTIDLRISYLRSKLADDILHPFRIKTIRGKGYVFQPDAWD